jgi:hypothetical protein
MQKMNFLCGYPGGCAMWRFVLMSFVFLGWAFYEMSGGADYRPSANSIQARALLDNQRPRARPLRANVIELAAPAPAPAPQRDVTTLEELGRAMPGAGAGVTLASAEAPRIAVPTVALGGAAARETAAAAPPAYRRRVSGNAVNLRSGPGMGFGRIARLERGQEVEVLRDKAGGWVRLRVAGSGQVGWAAESLLAAAE